jgi:glucose/arabinose dehydrogenase
MRFLEIAALVSAASAAAVLVGCPSSSTTGGTSTGTPTGSTSSSSSSSTTGTATSSSSTSSSSGSTSSGTCTIPSTPGSNVDGGIASPCSLPGSVQFTNSGAVVVPGGTNSADLSFLHLPVGFCAHYYGNVGNARQMRFAPGGELFVSSPTTGTTSNGQNGLGGIVVLPDDNHDGVADTNITFLSGLPSTQGLLFANGSFYYQDSTSIMKLPYASGDRKPSGAATTAVDITYSSDILHWPKTLDIADDCTIYVGNGGSQADQCIQPPPVKGAILKIDGSSGGSVVATGFRNPIAVRCQRGHNRCFALELAKDYTSGQNGREKLVPIHQGDDWGFPCCATANLPYEGVTTQDGGTPNCSSTVAENDSFLIGDTPFGVDFEPGLWPAPYTNSAFVALHGAAGSWTGTRIVAITVDAATGEPNAGTNMTPGAGDMGGMTDFATGWDDSSLAHGRATAVTFSPDGRLFVANDQNGIIFWIAAI